MPSILIVDDEPQNLNALRRVFNDRRPSWTVYTATNEAGASASLEEHLVDVVITDLVMTTDQSGMEVLQKAKAKDPFCMVILITAFEKQLDRYRAFELGAFDCVQKNTPNVVAAEEIFVKTQAALRFRELTLEQLETQRRLAFLKRYFDPRVLGTLEKNPELLSIRNDTLTVSFWDIRGFSRLCESLKAHPALVAGFLREFSQAAAEVIFDHHGVLDKYIGDGVMGLFGAINHRNDEGRQDAVHAVGAAMDMMRRFGAVVGKWTEQFVLYTPQTVDIGLGCGIHTGEALVGNVGTEVRDHYTALGPNVNFAQRIEARSAKNEILISSSTEARVRGHFELREHAVIKDVKNIPGEFRIYSVVGAKTHAK